MSGTILFKVGLVMVGLVRVGLLTSLRLDCPSPSSSRKAGRVQGWSRGKVGGVQGVGAVQGCWSESKVGASPRLERVQGWSESKVGASPRLERVQVWSESNVGASPMLERGQGWSESKVGASSRLERVQGCWSESKVGWSKSKV